ncbi:redox-regulated ATPase YchF [Patescibacteria group bacterium]
MKIGIVGLPNVGKSTLFSALTKKQVDISNYPFCTIDPNVGIVAISDERVDKLAELSKSAKKIYATTEFVDIAGIVEGANKGEGLGNKFLANIRETDAILYILRAFSDNKIINTRSEINPVSDKEILETELMLKDLETVEKRLHSLEREIRSGDKDALKEKVVLKKAQRSLEEGKMLNEKNLEDSEKKILGSYQLLSSKPRLYILNGQKDKIDEKIINTFTQNHWPFLVIDILEEMDATGLSKEEKISFGLSLDSQLDTLIKKAYELLGLMTFFTTGTDETRAWNIKKGSSAPKAGRAIHTDFEDKFIRADIVSCDDFIKAGSWSKARELGILRTEGKDYIVKDGDIIEFKI